MMAYMSNTDTAFDKNVSSALLKKTHYLRTWFFWSELTVLIQK